MRAIEIDKKGKKREVDVSRKALTRDFEMHTRDLRPIFSLRQMPTIARRGKGIVINFRSTKILVGVDKIYVFNLSSYKILNSFIPDLSEKIKSRDKKNRVEHIVLETAMAFISQRMKSTFAKIHQKANFMLEMFSDQGVVSDEILEELLSLKKQLSNLSKNVREITEILDDILEDDEEMTDLYFIKKVENIDDVESILDDNLEQLEDISSQIDELDNNIDDTQEILTLKLSSRRNEIIKFDLLLTSVTAIFSFLAVVTGLFGMNIKNNLETSHMSFLAVTVLMIFVSLLALVWLWHWMRKSKIL